MQFRLRRFVLLLSLTSVSLAFAAEERPRWELGLGLGVIYQPDYLGASERSSYVAPFPFFVYRTPKYSIAREGIKGSLIGGERWGVGLAVGGTLPVDSEDNEARKGMEDLDATFKIGPSPNLLLYSGYRSSLHFEVPIRAAISLGDGSYQGMTTNPRWVWRARQGVWRGSLAAGPVYSNKKYHERIYAVSPREATSTRPVFEGKGGLSGVRLSMAISRRSSKYFWGMFVSYTDFGDAENRQSALLEEGYSVSVGLAFTSLFKQSADTVIVRHMSQSEN